MLPTLRLLHGVPYLWRIIYWTKVTARVWCISSLVTPPCVCVISFDGITELLKLLPKGMDGSLLEAAIKALCSLLKDADGRDAFITAGGVPFLVHLLDHPSAEVVSSAMSMLATMAGNSMAQEAIRWAGSNTP